MGRLKHLRFLYLRKNCIAKSENTSFYITKGTTLGNILCIDVFDLIQMEFIMTTFLYMPFNEEDNLKEEEIDKKSELLDK